MGFEDFRPPAMLLALLRRLDVRREQAIGVVGSERCRTWRMHMAGMALAFDR